MARVVPECPEPAGSWRPMPLSTWSEGLQGPGTLGHGLSYFVDFQAWSYSAAAPTQGVSPGPCPGGVQSQAERRGQKMAASSWGTAAQDQASKSFQPHPPNTLLGEWEHGPVLTQDSAPFGGGYRLGAKWVWAGPSSESLLPVLDHRLTWRCRALEKPPPSCSAVGCGVTSVREHSYPPSLPDPWEWAIECQMPEEATPERDQGSGKGVPPGRRTFLFTS